MNKWLMGLALMLATLMVVACGPKEEETPPPPPPGAPIGPPEADEPVDEEPMDEEAMATPEGLQSEIEGLIAAAEDSDPEAMLGAVEGLYLADYETFFVDNFGEDMGMELADGYETFQDDPAEYTEAFQDQVQGGSTVVVAEDLSPDNPNLQEELVPVAEAIVGDATLYSVSLAAEEGEEGDYAGVWAEVDGEWYFVGMQEMFLDAAEAAGATGDDDVVADDDVIVDTEADTDMRDEDTR